jgi:uncharacterized damage-inducible protein DinB
MEDLRYPVGRFDSKSPLPVGGRSALIESLAAAPSRLRQAVETLSDAQLDTPYRDGGWTVRQVVHHVPESHMNAYIRMKWGLTENAPLIKTYDENLWAQLPDDRTGEIEPSLTLLDALHKRWVILLNSMSDTDYNRTIKHPEWGQVDLQTLLKLYEWHGRHHVAHVTHLRERSGW